MALTLFDTLAPLARFDEDFGRMMRRVMQSPVADFVPAVDVVHDGEKTVITLEIPGIDPEKDLDIEVSSGRLTVSGTKRETREIRDEDRYIAREIRTGSFERVFGLPEGVTSEDVEAEYKDGQLSLTVREPAKKAVTKIAVQHGGATAAVEAGETAPATGAEQG